MINPMKLMQIRGMIERFQNNHPRIPAFMNAAVAGISEGAIVEMSVTTAEGKKITANIRVTADDMQLIREVQSME